MPIRKLTSGEKTLLKSVFGATTLPYDDQDIDWNSAEWGGRTNSITMGIVPHMAVTIWTPDFTGAPDNAKYQLVHEMAHVWHWYHGGSNIRSFLWTGLTHLTSYASAYYYDLADNDDITDFNFEQQAAIIADYWYVTQGHPPQKNNGTKKSLADYQPFINQIQSSGPPQDLSQTAKYANRPDSRPL
jgi:hypothetical protein